jgi:hypothetical protein
VRIKRARSVYQFQLQRQSHHRLAKTGIPKYLNARDRQATFGLAHSSSGAIVIACKPIAVPWLAQKAKRWGLELIQAWRCGAHSTIAGCDPLSGRTTDGSRG